MITLIHGDQLSVLHKLDQLRQSQSGSNLSELDGSISFIQLQQNLSGQDLFADKRLIIVQNPPDSWDLTELDEGSNHLILYLTRPLSATSSLWKSAQLKKASSFEFKAKPDAPVWPFLEALFMQDKKALAEFDKVYLQYGGQYLLTMVYYGLRRLIVPLKGPEFVQAKLRVQRQKFPLSKLTDLYYLSLEAEFKIKSGLAEEKPALTRLIVQILN